ncbi:hypothetical protein D3C81_511350 [compost metagenome]
MNKNQYFQNLEEIIISPLFIGSSKNDLSEEISNNMWRISLEQDLDSVIRIEDFLLFFDKLIENRQRQIMESNNQQGMIFYLWFDWMASQLRFNLISRVHERLPFQCELELIENMEPILKEFIEFPYLNGLPIGDDPNVLMESEEGPYLLKVYKRDLM